MKKGSTKVEMMKRGFQKSNIKSEEGASKQELNRKSIKYGNEKKYLAKETQSSLCSSKN
jgi:hypothetical protein